MTLSDQNFPMELMHGCAGTFALESKREGYPELFSSAEEKR